MSESKRTEERTRAREEVGTVGSPSTWLLIDAKGCGCSAENAREGGDGRERMGENGQGKIGGATSNSICRLLNFMAQTGYVFIQGEDCK